MKPHPPDPTPLFDLAVAYWRSCALFAALDLGVFDALGEEPLAATELARRLDLPERSLAMLADALVAMGLLACGADGLANSPRAQAWLRRDAPQSLREAILFNARSYATWGKLSAAVRAGAPATRPRDILGDDPAATRNFILAMRARAQGAACCLVDMLDLAGCRRLLDLGGGPATYAALLAERYPEIEVTVIDLPGVLTVAEELLRDAPARERIRLQPGDIFRDPFGEDYDAVLLSGVLHRTRGDATTALLRKAAAALAPGGRLAVSDLFTGAEAHGPVLPELFSLHMLLTADEGGSLPLAAMADHLLAAGLRLTSIRPYPPPLPHTLVLAEKR